MHKHQKKNNNNSVDGNGSGRCVGFNVSIPISHLTLLDEFAKNKNWSRSELVRQAVYAYINIQTEDDDG